MNTFFEDTGTVFPSINFPIEISNSPVINFASARTPIKNLIIIAEDNYGNFKLFDSNSDSVLDFVSTPTYSFLSIDKKEDFYITAIKNLIKKVRFFQLLIDLSEKSITEKQFQKELKTNPDKYIINTEYLKNSDDIVVITEIMKRIDVEMDIDEIAETFSIELSSLTDTLTAKTSLY